MRHYEICLSNLNMCVPFILMASYIKDADTPLPDYEFDAICKLALDNWGEIRHKRLIKRGDLQAGSLGHLREYQYPLRVRSAAWSWRQVIDIT